MRSIIYNAPVDCRKSRCMTVYNEYKPSQSPDRNFRNIYSTGRWAPDYLTPPLNGNSNENNDKAQSDTSTCFVCFKVLLKFLFCSEIKSASSYRWKHGQYRWWQHTGVRTMNRAFDEAKFNEYRLVADVIYLVCYTNVRCVVRHTRHGTALVDVYSGHHRNMVLVTQIAPQSGKCFLINQQKIQSSIT